VISYLLREEVVDKWFEEKNRCWRAALGVTGGDGDGQDRQRTESRGSREKQRVGDEQS